MRQHPQGVHNVVEVNPLHTHTPLKGGSEVVDPSTLLLHLLLPTVVVGVVA